MIYQEEMEINNMTIDATFWVAVSFFLFFGGLIYLKVPNKINDILNKLISDKSNPIVSIDSTDYHFICDNVSVNQFQELLNNAKSIKVTRIK